MKAFASREIDWQDVRMTIARQESLDWPYIEKELGSLALLKEEPEIMIRLKKLRERLSRKAE